MKKNKHGSVAKRNEFITLKRFIEELSWLLDSYSKIDIKSALNLLDAGIKEPIEAKKAIGNYQSSNPNKDFLVGVLPRLFNDQSLFPSNDDLADFALSILNIQIARYYKKSKFEIIGHIVCQVNNLNDEGLSKLVKALGVIAGDDKKMKELINKRTKENFGWNAIIQELSAQE